MTTIRILISLAIKKGWDMYQLDVNNAFLHGDLHEEVYMDIPPGLMVTDTRMICKLKKSLYGLKQASRQWYDKLAQFLYSRGYSHSTNDYSLFYRKIGSSLVFVAVCVDDVIITGTDIIEITSLKNSLHNEFKIKDLGRLQYFLGLEILYKDSGVIISQRKFTIDLLHEFDCSDCKSVSSPLESTVKLKAGEGILLTDPTYYRKLVGKLNFLTNTRMDIAFSVQYLSQFLQNPREPHLKVAYHVLRYLKNDPCLGIHLSNNADCSITTYCDSDWAACPDTRKSVSGYVVLMGDSPVSWKSKKQTTISLSSAKAEYRAIRKAVGELVWLERLLIELNLPCKLPISVFCDSQTAIHISKNPVFHERTKHIEVDCHFVREKKYKNDSSHSITSQQIIS
ncbi:uncharacterized mitochondrial protein AtMg00810-like [Solanum tuberosum]|uniref:uncharacterized mitochondrial protein AtMg00810-like n=1 Tax=Solanum tuberosum TaxID=4113 RepID=UPI00073A1BDC|nr:PREDICTED: uncharacterized mitochondrial protein AtMg00810-like [Solanum tuberosum]